MTDTALEPTALEVKRSLENLRLELDAIALYDALAQIERDRERAAAFKRIAANERRHAEIWAQRLETGEALDPPAELPLAVYPVVVEGDTIVLELPDGAIPINE